MFDRHHIIGLLTVITLLFSVACGSDDDDDGSSGSAGSTAGAGAGGTSGSEAGAGGQAGAGGTAGAGGSAGSSAGSGGSQTVYTDEIQTASGPVQGTVYEGVRKFMGIPFAASTAGQNRWKPPQPVAAWTETLVAEGAGAACPQMDSTSGAYHASADEDCLALNVWTPDLAPAEPLPVMVWIHGGAFSIGRGSDRAYDGGNLVRNGEVVVVTVNYRLGAIGFLAHTGLSAEDPDGVSGNYGLLDQRAALEWVRDNIAAFGGDSTNVTVFGESAGGRSAVLHMIMPGSQGLFHKAIVESGYPTAGLKDLDFMEQRGARFAAAMGCDQQDDAEAVACLRALDAETITAGPEEPPAQLPGGIAYQDPESSLSFEPLMDGEHIPGQPGDLYASADAPSLPVLHGANTSEGTLFHVGVFGDLPVQTEAEYQQALSRNFGDAATEVAAQYPGASYPTPTDAIIDVTGDAVFVCPARGLAKLLAAAGTPNYLYSFDRPVEGAPALLVYPELQEIAFHAAEIPYVFHNTGFILGNLSDQTAADAIMGYWTRFAHTGDPNSDGAPTWPAYDPAADEILSISDPIETITGHRKDNCDFWEGLIAAGKI